MADGLLFAIGFFYFSPSTEFVKKASGQPPCLSMILSITFIMRMVSEMAKRGERITDDGGLIITPAARDMAVRLGMLKRGR